MSQPLNPPSYPSQQAQPTIIPPQKATSTLTLPVDTRVNKRQCPECGAVGFAIREVDDKSRIISYVPRQKESLY